MATTNENDQPNNNIEQNLEQPRENSFEENAQSALSNEADVTFDRGRRAALPVTEAPRQGNSSLPGLRLTEPAAQRSAENNNTHTTTAPETTNTLPANRAQQSSEAQQSSPSEQSRPEAKPQRQEGSNSGPLENNSEAGSLPQLREGSKPSGASNEAPESTPVPAVSNEASGTKPESTGNGASSSPEAGAIPATTQEGSKPSNESGATPESGNLPETKPSGTKPSNENGATPESGNLPESRPSDTKPGESGVGGLLDGILNNDQSVPKPPENTSNRHNESPDDKNLPPGLPAVKPSESGSHSPEPAQEGGLANMLPRSTPRPEDRNESGGGQTDKNSKIPEPKPNPSGSSSPGETALNLIGGAAAGLPLGSPLPQEGGPAASKPHSQRPGSGDAQSLTQLIAGQIPNPNPGGGSSGDLSPSPTEKKTLLNGGGVPAASDAQDPIPSRTDRHGQQNGTADNPVVPAVPSPGNPHPLPGQSGAVTTEMGNAILNGLGSQIPAPTDGKVTTSGSPRDPVGSLGDFVRTVMDNPGSGSQSPIPSPGKILSDGQIRNPESGDTTRPLQNLLNNPFEQQRLPERLEPKLETPRLIDNRSDADRPPVQLLSQILNTLDREARQTQVLPQNPQNRDERDDKDRDHEAQLRLQFQGPVLAPSQRPDDGTDSIAARPNPSINKLEMQSLADDRRPNIITQLLNKVESSIEQKFQSLVSTMNDLRSPRESAVPQVLSPGAQSQIAAKQELPFLQQLTRMIDISVDFKRTTTDAGKFAIDPNNPNIIGLGGRVSVTEPMSLKDLIAAAKGDPAGIMPGRNGIEPIALIKGPDGRLVPVDGRFIGAEGKPLIGADGKPVLGPDGKPIMIGADGKPIMVGADGRPLGPDGRPIAGIKGAESIDDKKDGKILPGLDGKLPGEEFEDGDDDRKDKIDKVCEGDDDGDLIGMVPCSDKIKDKKKDGKDGNKAGKDEKKEEETRRKYVVREGDTLESIAEKIIGDSRFSTLLEMINRGYIRYNWQGSVRKPMLRVGQTIWLPTSNEVKVHRTLFFTKKDNAGNANEKGEDLSLTERSYGSLPVVDVADFEEEKKAAKARKNSKAEKNSKETKVSKQDSTVVINFAAGANSTANSESFEAQTSNESVTDESASDWVQIQEFLNRMRIAAETGRLARETEKEDTDTQELPLIADDNLDIKQLDDRNRIIVENSMVDDEEIFIARLEKQYVGEWKVVAYYESSYGRAVRYLHKANGSRRAFHLNLPDFVVREMAIKDLSRNWKTYSTEFEAADKVKTRKMAAAS